MSQPTRTEAIGNFLRAKTHSDLAALYNHDMEVQVNVSQDGGQRVEGDFQGRQWHGWTDGVQTWKSFRIPFGASTPNANYEDRIMNFDLAEHAEGIGMTGWNWVAKKSLWFGFDFDKITEHAKGLTDSQLAEVEAAAELIPWTTIRRSTSGSGRHIYVFVDAINTTSHTEHAALARAILGIMSALAKFDFQARIDCVGGNMWVWHRKMEGTNGLELIKQGEKLTEIPPNWRDHIPVITGKRTKNLPQFIEECEISDSEKLFAELTGQRPKTPLDVDHKRLIDWLKDHGAVWWWDNDHHMLVTHTIYLKEAHEELGFKGVFRTIATGKDRGNDQNVFGFPMRKGAWVFRRYSPGVAEDATWDQDPNGWTRTYFNREADLASSSRTHEGVEHPSGGYVFQQADQAQQAALMLGADLKLPNWANGRKAKLKEHKDGRLIAEIDHDPSRDDAGQMKGWLAEGKVWKRILNTSNGTPNEPEIGNYDELVRHLVTETGSDFGWMYKGDDENWREEPFLHVKTALKGKGWSPKDSDVILGAAISRAWILVNKPFDSEYPGNRQWNRGAAQFKFLPTQNRDKLYYPSWLKILNHIGSGLDEAIRQMPWAQKNGVLTGADYLKCWIASLFQFPTDPLPYLFFYGEQNSGKSIFHEAIKLLITHGVDRADNALKNKSGFNEEIAHLILCVVEETDLKRDKEAYNKIKDWVLSPTIQIHPKGRKPYSIPNLSHWVQTSNHFDSCPIEIGDTRITMIEVQQLDPTNLVPKKMFMNQLEKEAPDFLASVLSLEIPPSNDRLNLPIVVTEQKAQIEKVNQTLLEAFIMENCHEVTGKYILFSEFCDKFYEWVGAGQAEDWSKIKIGREIPPKYPAARLPRTGYKAIGNIAWEARLSTDIILPKLVVRQDKLVPGGSA